MKNLNLIKRLWTDSHEKQKPQRSGRYAVMLIMLLTLGVGQMWGTDRTYDGSTYFFWNMTPSSASWWNNDGPTHKITLKKSDGTEVAQKDATGTADGKAFYLVPAGTYKEFKLQRGSWNTTGWIPFDSDAAKNYLSNFSENGTSGTFEKYGTTFTEDAVLYFTMASWWTNYDGSGGYHNVTMTKIDGTTTSKIPVYKRDDYLNNGTTTNNVLGGTVEMFVTIPAGTYTKIKFHRGSSNDSDWNTCEFSTLSTSKNKDSQNISSDSHTPNWNSEYKPTSTGSVMPSSSSVSLNTEVTMTPSLTSNTLLNNLKSTVYGVSPGTSGTDWTMVGNVFTPLKAGTYTITATITYNAKGFPSLTSTVTPTTTVTANATITLDKNGGTANGSAVFAPNATSYTSITHATYVGGILEGYYNDNVYTTKVLNADGSFAATNVTGYITDGKWTCSTNTTLYAKWTVTMTPVAKYTNDGSTYTESTTGGIVTINGNSSATQVIEGATYEIVATPASGYCVEEIKVGDAVAWSQPNDDSRQTAAKTISTYTATAATNVTVKFAKLQNITLYIHDGGVGGLVLQNYQAKVGEHNVLSSNTTLTAANNGWYYHTFANVTNVSLLNVACANIEPASSANGGQPIGNYLLTQTAYFSAIEAQNTVHSSICDLISVSYTDQEYVKDAAPITLSPTYKLGYSASATYAWTVTTQPVGGAYTLSATNVASPTFSSSVPGTYTLQVQVTSDGCTKSTSFNIEVSGSSSPEITAATFVHNPILTTDHLQVSISYHRIPAEGCYIRLKQGAGYYNDEADQAYTAISEGSGSLTFTTKITNVPSGVWTVELLNQAKNVTLHSLNVTGTLTVKTGHTITVTAGANGTVSPSTVYAGDGIRSADFTATPNTGYVFNGWTKTASGESFTLNDASSATTYVTTATYSGTVRADFVGASHALTLNSAGHGSIISSPAGIARTGETVTITPTPDSGYEFDYIEVNSVSQGSGVTTFTMPGEDVTVTAHFKQGPTLGAVTATPSGTQNYAGSPIDFALSVTSTYMAHPVVVFLVNDGTTTFEVVGAPYGADGSSAVGTIGSDAANTTVHKATFTAFAAKSYTVSAKLYEGLLVENFETADYTSWESVGGGSSSIVSNLSVSANNGSPKVRRITPNGEDWKTSLTRSTAKWANGYQYIHTKMYYTAGGELRFKISDAPVELAAAHGTNGQWNKVVFNNSGKVNIDFMFPWIVSNTSVFYIDDIILSNEASMTEKASQAATASFSINWNYTVTLNNNGATSAGTESVNVTYGSATGITDITVPTKTGYTFGGYYTEDAGAGTLQINASGVWQNAAYVADGKWNSGSNQTLYAKWTVKNYNIIYDPVSAPTGATYTTTPSSANYNSTVDVVITPTAANYIIDVTAEDEYSNTVTVTNPSTNTYRFTMPAGDVTVSVNVSSLPIVYVLKTKHANSSLGEDVTEFPSEGKIWAWRPSGSQNFYKGIAWGTRPTASSAATSVTDDIVGDTWYRFIPNNTDYFNASTEYRVILTTGNDVEILNTNTEHIEDGSYSSSGSSQTGTIWVVPHGTGQHTAYVYTSYPDEIATPYNVTYNAGDHGSINAFGTTVNSGTTQTIATTKNRTLTATPTSGYGFDRWVTTGGVSVADARSATTTVSATANGGTVTAMWYESVNSNWYIKGDPAGSWDDPTTCPLDRVFPGETNVYYRAVTLESGNRYFRFYTNVNGNKNQYGASLQDNLYVSKNTEYDLTQDGSNNFIYNAGGTIWVVVDASGGTKKCWVQDPQVYYVVTFSPCVGGAVSAVDGSSNPLTSGKGYISGTAITFTQTPSEGYTFKEWNTAADGNGEKLGDDEDGYTIASLSDDVEVYAVYTEDMHTLALNNDGHGKVQIGGVDQTSASVGVATTATITAVPAEGYHFLNWTVDAGVTNVTGSTTANPIEVKTTSDGKSVTANFEADKYIYFDNTYTQWDHVWVYLFSNNSWWNDGEQGVHPGVNIVAYAEMTLVSGEENLYEYAYHNSSHNYSFSHVAFCKADQHGNTAFYATEAAYRGDWNATMPIYVAPSAYTTTNEVKYHSGGYWMMKETTAGESVGYALRHKTGESTSAEDGKFKATADGSHVATITLRYDDTSDKTYFINNLSSQNYSLNHTFTSVDNGTAYSIYHYDDIVQFTVKPTSVGLYTFTLEQGPEYMQLSVQYPVQIGDYRVVYSRSIRKKDDSADSTAYRYSDVIRNGTAKAMTSMYINNSDKDKGLKLQTCTGFDASKNPIWGDVAGSTGLISYFAGKDAGVYQFNVNIDATTPSYTISDIAEYSGSYYIKTDCAPGGWANYTQNVMDKNTIKYDGTDATYDYYMCKWIGGTTTNVKCVIANEYNNAISDTLVSDAILTRNNIAYETLPYAANVRFSYNSATNTLKRTYLLGSADANSFLYIVANQDDYVYKTDGTTDLHDETESNRKFTDAGNWTYQMEVKAYPGATGGVRTKYPTVAPITEQILIPDDNILIDGDEKGSTLYDIRLVYDFKTNYLMAAWVASTPAASITLDADMLIIRKLQEAASQVTLGSKTISEVHTIYGAIQFDYDDMVGNLGSWAGNYGKLMYDISFPFDVNVSDIFGAGDINDHWIIQKYDGAERASIGWFAETNTFWKTLTTADKMNAYEGYTLIIDRPSFNSSSSSIWINKTSGSSVYLYFPSASDADKTISSGTASIVVPEHKCTIDRSWTPAGGGGELNHQNTDSHWNMIGTPLFENAAAATVVSSSDASAKSLNYYYEWNPANNTYNVASAAAISTTNPSAFKAMHGYMVQWAGTITFSGSHISSSVAARRLPSNENYQLELRMANVNGDYSRAYVELCENACDTFALNEDMYMMRSSKMADLYTYAGNYDVSANVLSVNNHIVPVGMDVKVAGLYTFSMPSEFSGSVVLIDTYTGARTNLALGDYEVNLTKGTLNDRFLLEINIHNAPTAIEGIEGGSLKDGKAHKFVQNGVMYILRDGKIYDARGAKVK